MKDRKFKTKTIKFGNLVPGDRIIGPDGKPVTVTNVYEKHFPDTMYEIEMEDGEVIQASGNHLWYCESEIDVKNKDEYLRLAKKFFESEVIPEKEDDEPFTTLGEIITLFGDEIYTQLFIEKVCRSLGHSRVGPHVIVEDEYAIKETLKYYSYNDLIDFLHEMKKAVMDNQGYFFFGEVRETKEIAKLMEKGVEVNIPTREEIANG